MKNSSAYVVLGATGHVGSVVARRLLAEGQDVIAVVREKAKAARLQSEGAEIAVVDVADVQSLGSVLRRGRRAFLLNPPAAVDTDTDAAENRTAAAIAEAVAAAALEKVLVESTYGAMPGNAIGDLSVLWNFERHVEASGVPAAINRGAYYFTNLDVLVSGAREGAIETMIPAQMKIPMVAPADLGAAAVARLTDDTDDAGVRYVEGPARCSFHDVAAAFAKALGHPVTVRTIDRADWEPGFRKLGFSDAAARAYAKMTTATVDHLELPDRPDRGSTTLEAYISELVTRSA